MRNFARNIRPQLTQGAWSIASAFCALAFLACADKPQPPATPAVAEAVAPRAPAPGDPTCPRDGKWKSCALVDRIVHAGLFFKAADDSVAVAFLRPMGIKYQVGLSASLIAFYYADTLALERDWATIDTLRLTVVGDTIGPWPSPPDVIRSANLVAAFFNGDALQRERIRLAITAGAPQPPSVAPVMLPVQKAR